MDGARFDRLARALGAAPSRRRLAAGLGLMAGALLGRGAAAQDLGAETCRERLARCDDRGQCCEAEASHRIGCAGVSEFCIFESEPIEGKRCCGRGGAKCAGSCACCAGYRCVDGQCRPIEQCEANTCCHCSRCDDETRECERLFCATGLSRRACARRCRRQGGHRIFVDGKDGYGSGIAMRFECGNWGCTNVCPSPRF